MIERVQQRACSSVRLLSKEMAGSKLAAVVVVVLAVAACLGTVQGANLRLDQAQMSQGCYDSYHNKNFRAQKLNGSCKDGYTKNGLLCYGPCKDGYFRFGTRCRKDIGCGDKTAKA